MPKPTKRFRQRLEQLLTAPGEELGNWAKFARYQIQMWRFCTRKLREHNAMAMSAALSFRTLFAMVPILVLTFLVLKNVGVIQDSSIAIRQILVQAGFEEIKADSEPSDPASGPTIKRAEESSNLEYPSVEFGSDPIKQAEEAKLRRQAKRKKRKDMNLVDRIEKIAADAEKKLTLGRIGPIGVVLLIWTAVTLLTTVERSLNRIFQAPRSRPLAKRVLLYWSVLTFVPIAMVSAMYVGEKASTVFHAAAPNISGLVDAVSWVAQILVGLLLLAMVYMFMPNTRVKFASAFTAACVAGPLWLLGKWGFSLYVQHTVTARSLYGVLGMLPLFLMWINLSWLFFLFGAELAHTAANVKRLVSAETAEKILLGPWELLAAALVVARSYVVGGGPVERSDIAEKLDLPAESVHRLLGRLEAGGVVCPVESGDRRYVLARPADSITVTQIFAMGSAESGELHESIAPEIASAIADVRSSAEGVLKSTSLSDLVKIGGPSPQEE